MVHEFPWILMNANNNAMTKGEANEFYTDLEKIFNTFFLSIGFKKKAKGWYKEYEDFTLIFKLRKNTIWKSVYVDYGGLLKSLELPYDFKLLNWHLFGGLGHFDRKYNLGIEKLDENERIELRDFIKKNVIPILELACSPNSLINFPYDKVYGYMKPSGKIVIEAINKFKVLNSNN